MINVGRSAQYSLLASNNHSLVFSAFQKKIPQSISLETDQDKIKNLCDAIVKIKPDNTAETAKRARGLIVKLTKLFMHGRTSISSGELDDLCQNHISCVIKYKNYTELETIKMLYENNYIGRIDKDFFSPPVKSLKEPAAAEQRGPRWWLNKLISYRKNKTCSDTFEPDKLPAKDPSGAFYIQSYDAELLQSAREKLKTLPNGSFSGKQQVYTNAMKGDRQALGVLAFNDLTACGYDPTSVDAKLLKQALIIEYGAWTFKEKPAFKYIDTVDLPEEEIDRLRKSLLDPKVLFDGSDDAKRAQQRVIEAFGILSTGLEDKDDTELARIVKDFARGNFGLLRQEMMARYRMYNPADTSDEPSFIMNFIPPEDLIRYVKLRLDND